MFVQFFNAWQFVAMITKTFITSELFGHSYITFLHVEKDYAEYDVLIAVTLKNSVFGMELSVV
jgi:hypothetical protein